LAGRPMAGIARNIELYNLAYRLAWKLSLQTGLEAHFRASEA
jgi:hypothetical protein